MVGAGVGGLYTAARLAKAGVQTTLVEQNPREDAGGRLETIWLDAADRRFRFEVGPSLLLLPGVYREALETLGLDADAHLDLARVAPAYAVHYRDGGPTPLEVGGDAQAEARLRAAMDSVEPGAHDSFRAYMDAAQANLHAGLPIFIREQLTPDSLSRLPRFLSAALLGGGGPAARRSAPLVDWPLRTHAAQLEDRFDAPRHRALLGFQVRGAYRGSQTCPHNSPSSVALGLAPKLSPRPPLCCQDLYVGLPPAEAPAVFSLLQAIELEDQGDDGAPLGVYYPTGGFGTFRDALLAACEAAGVELRFGTRVAAVEVEEGQVRGVRLAEVNSVIAGEAASGDGGDGGGGGDSGGGGGGGGGAASGELLGAACVVVNADVAAAEGALLAPHLRRSSYDEVSEVGGGDGPVETGEATTGAATEAATAGVGVGGVLAAATSAARGEDRAWRYSTSSVTFLF